MTDFKKLAHLLVERLRSRQDSEHEQALIRVGLVGGVFVYFRLVEGALPVPGVSHEAISRALALYEFLSIVYVLWIFASPERNRLRRLLAMATDIGAISLNMFLGGEVGAPLYPLYLWVILGNGFRFGLKYLLASTIMGVAGFTLVLSLTSPWQDHLPLSFGLLAGVAAVPAYAASLIRKLTEAKMHAEAASRAKSRFLAIISHELRTPLNAIIGMSDLLSGTRLDDDQIDMARTIHLSGQALLSLIDSVLDFSRIEAGKTKIMAESTDLHRNLAELVAVMRHQATEKDLSLQVSIGSDVPPMVQADWPHIRQILTNLLANAIKFTDAGHIALRVARRSSPSGDRLLFEVEDTGIGIPEEKLGLIFDAFAQAEDTMNRRFGGSGLGLAISRQLSELMDGKLSVESRVGQGSRFSCDLPLVFAVSEPALPIPLHVIGFCKNQDVLSPMVRLVERVSAMTNREQAEAALATATVRHPATLLLDDVAGADVESLMVTAQALGVPIMTVGVSAEGAEQALVAIKADDAEQERINALRVCRVFAGRGFYVERSSAPPAEQSRRILVAEDNRVNVKVVRKILEKAGHHVDVVGSGDAMLDAMLDGTYDIVVADVNMPGTPLTDVVKLHRMATSHLAPLPIVALSADATVETRRDCEAAGVDDYLTKPVVASLLLSTIDRLTRRNASAGMVAPANVADLTKHPAFTGPGVLPIDWPTIDALVELGDRELVRELATDFVDDATLLIDAMERSVACGDRQHFRADCHALRSSAANVGARGITRLCQDGAIKTADFASEGGPFCSRAREELTLFREEMAHYLDQVVPSAKRLC